MEKYDDIINLPHPEPAGHPRMYQRNIRKCHYMIEQPNLLRLLH